MFRSCGSIYNLPASFVEVYIDQASFDVLTAVIDVLISKCSDDDIKSIIIEKDLAEICLLNLLASGWVRLNNTLLIRK